MKKLIFACFAICLFATTPAFADSGNDGKYTNPLIVRSEIAGNDLEVIIANLNQASTYFTLIDLDRDREVYRDKIRKRNGYSYKLGMEKLKNGRYLLSVKKGDVVRQQVILISRNGMMCSDWK
ncbi:hypothetical protein [Neolewinella agarilytica]|uniref:Uncharacterized protein n=1 Tax=Neolewinella agarilytica TaxID=478744 RepID=A0A1H9AR79_9BACT|nr:hypothetical protein [Neolewinella agarilytica]SEP79045.1 hypothetical protein SAMN05444359_102192 [Neolewinella agarilytica]